jgi:hypothetical protein
MKNVVAVAVIAWLLAACAAAPCTPITVPAGVDQVNCPAGGTVCGGCEGQHCSGVWPFRSFCTTVWLGGGTCRCNCQ